MASDTWQVQRRWDHAGEEWCLLRMQDMDCTGNKCLASLPLVTPCTRYPRPRRHVRARSQDRDWHPLMQGDHRNVPEVERGMAGGRDLVAFSTTLGVWEIKWFSKAALVSNPSSGSQRKAGKGSSDSLGSHLRTNPAARSLKGRFRVREVVVKGKKSHHCNTGSHVPNLPKGVSITKFNFVKHVTPPL
ncbi:hypothetical protein B0H14DRAFT_2635396 [Mycena olivaceomarginata]|nr:hypothetical protein B0H14DRAFT_2635396 [Mycena olivaceomarginata]